MSRTLLGVRSHTDTVRRVRRGTAWCVRRLPTYHRHDDIRRVFLCAPWFQPTRWNDDTLCASRIIRQPSSRTATRQPRCSRPGGKSSFFVLVPVRQGGPQAPLKGWETHVVDFLPAGAGYGLRQCHTNPVHNHALNSSGWNLRKEGNIRQVVLCARWCGAARVRERTEAHLLDVLVVGAHGRLDVRLHLVVNLLALVELLAEGRGEGRPT